MNKSKLHNYTLFFTVDADPTGPRDFDNTQIDVTFDASGVEETQTAVLTITPDTINEATEGFIIRMEIVSISSADSQNLVPARRDTALFNILDNDGEFCGLQVVEL